MIIHVKNSYSTLESSEAIASLLYNAMAVPYKNKRFYASVKSGTWDGQKHFFSGSGNFLTGFLGIVTEILKAENIDSQLHDMRKKPDLHVLRPNLNMPFEFYPEQLDCVDTCIRSCRGLINYACNSGKTEIMAELVRRTGLRTLILTSRRILVLQTRESLEKYLNIPVGTAAMSIWDPKDITVGLGETLASPTRKKESIKFLKGVDMIIGDEFHHGPTENWRFVFNKSINAYYRFGFSGTLFSNDRVRNGYMNGVTGPLIGTWTTSELVDRGVSVPQITFFINIEDDEKVLGQGWHEIQYQLEMHHKRLSILIHIICDFTRKGKKVFVHCDHYEQAAVFVELLKHNGFTVGLAHGRGSNSAARNMETKDGFMEGKYDILVATPVFKEGINIPGIEVLVLAAGGTGAQKLVQIWGRGERRFEGKDRLIVVDCYDKIGPKVEKHSKARMRWAKRHGMEVHKVDSISEMMAILERG